MKLFDEKDASAFAPSAYCVVGVDCSFICGTIQLDVLGL
jgi:hypothetical protein